MSSSSSPSAPPPLRMVGVEHRSINPLVVLSAANGGEPVATALIDTASMRKGIAVNHRKRGLTVLEPLGSDSSLRLSEGTVYMSDSMLNMSGIQKVGADIKAGASLYV